MGCALGSPPEEQSQNTDTEKWDDFFPPMTAQQLEDKRTVFWETRVEGSTEVWQALKMSIDVRQIGDVETANTILTSIGCSQIKQDRGNKETKYIYGPQGVRYDVPMYIFEEPSNLIKDNVELENGVVMSSRAEGQLVEGEIDQNNVQFNNQNAKQIAFTVRLCVGGDIEMQESELASISEVKLKLSKKLNNLDPTKIRIVFKGKLLSDHYRLNAPFPIAEKDVLQAAFPSSLYKPDEAK